MTSGKRNLVLTVFILIVLFAALLTSCSDKSAPVTTALVTSEPPQTGAPISSGTVNTTTEPPLVTSVPAAKDENAPAYYFSFDNNGENGSFTELSGNECKSYGTPMLTEGKSGKALFLDGKSYLTFSADLPKKNEAHTIAAWVKSEDVSSITESVIAGWGSYQSLSDTRLMIYKGEYCATSYGGLTTFPVMGDEWVHVALTYKSNTYKLFVNGVCMGGYQTSGINVKSSALYIGAFAGGILKLKGAIDELCVYDRALTEKEVAMCMKGDLSFRDTSETKTTAFDIEADLPSGWTTYSYKAAGIVMKFDMYVPEGFDKNKEYPLVMFLHGDGGNGLTPENIRIGGEAVIARRAILEGEDCIVIVPAAPSRWLSVPNDKKVVYPYLDYAMEDATAERPLILAETLLDECIGSSFVDDDRVYLLGYSRGTMGSLYLLSKTPEKFAAVVVCCGASDVDSAYKYREVPLWMFMGDADELVDYEREKAVFDAYALAGGEGTFTRCYGAGHGLTSFLNTEEGIIEWLFSQKRQERTENIESRYTVNYYLDNNGERTLLESIKGKTQAGIRVDATVKSYSGYEYVESLSTPFGVTDKDTPLVLEVVYKAESTRIEIIYKGAGDKTPTKYSSAFNVGSKYSIVSPSVEGYYPDLSVISGTVGSKDLVFTVTYKEYRVNGSPDLASAVSGEWEIDAASGIYKAKNAGTHLMFDTLRFEGGRIEWDMTVPSDEYLYKNVCGVLFAADKDAPSLTSDDYYVFGRAFTSEFVGYAKDGGKFYWEDGEKLSPPTIECKAGVKYHFVLEWDTVNNIITLIFDGKAVSFIPSHKLSGSYIGLYSDVSGTEFSGIEITYKDYPYANGIKLSADSSFEIARDDNGNTSYKALTSSAAAIFSDISFEKGIIEWDMMVPDESYLYNALCGIVWHSEEELINIHTSLYYVTGRYKGGIFVSFAKYKDENGNTAFAWENSKQIASSADMAAGKTVHYRLEFDGEKITITVGDASVTLTPVHKISGDHIGIYTEVVGTVISNITVTPID